MDFKKKVLDNITDVQSLMILLAYADNTPVRGQLKLQKIMYLLSDRIEKLQDQSSYESDMLGPYSEVVDEEYEYLKEIGVFQADTNRIFPTKEGLEIAKELEKKENPRTIQLIKDFKNFMNDLTSDELLCFIYSAYPEMTDESVEYGRLKPKMEDIILSLVRKNKISLERAAELLKKSPEYIIKKMKEKGIPVIS